MKDKRMMNDERIQHIIDEHTKQLDVLEIQKAKFGDLHVPAHIAVEIKELQAKIDALNDQRTQIIYQISHLSLTAAPQAKGLIVLVSPSKNNSIEGLATYRAIDHHRSLQRCWLVATTGENSSEETAKALAKHFSFHRVECTIHTITNAADALETQTLVSSLLAAIRADNRFADGEVIADITAGTKAMTAGMVLACGSTWKMQCMFFQHDLPSLPVLQHTSVEVV